ncbi:MAG: J domain-containing protein [Promethearchaeota archaeon]
MARELDFYRILGVTPKTSYEEIRIKYRKLAKQYHPDLNPGNPYAEETFKLINVAYEVLKDPERRAKYNLLREYGIDPRNIFRRNPEEIELDELLELIQKEFVKLVNSLIKNFIRFLRSLNPLRTFRKIIFDK